jgi:hypothetical protein
LIQILICCTNSYFVFEELIVTKIQIELPDATAQAAGLLTPQALDRLLSGALRKQHAGDVLLSIADKLAAAGVEPMTMEEIQAEVNAVRAARRASAR